jgi:sec-independent protein translocase protein TatB
MFDLSWSELLLIGVVALIFIGPKELPGVLRTLGQWMSKIRRMAGDFQNQFHDAMREAELADLKKEVDEMAKKASSFTEFDPVADVRREFEDTQRQIENAVKDPLVPQQQANVSTPVPEPVIPAPPEESAAIAPEAPTPTSAPDTRAPATTAPAEPVPVTSAAVMSAQPVKPQTGGAE